MILNILLLIKFSNFSSIIRNYFYLILMTQIVMEIEIMNQKLPLLCDI
jgi:hypothetical protein